MQLSFCVTLYQFSTFQIHVFTPLFMALTLGIPLYIKRPANEFWNKTSTKSVSYILIVWPFVLHMYCELCLHDCLVRASLNLKTPCVGLHRQNFHKCPLLFYKWTRFSQEIMHSFNLTWTRCKHGAFTVTHHWLTC